jgi:hypothetical protein
MVNRDGSSLEFFLLEALPSIYVDLIAEARVLFWR